MFVPQTEATAAQLRWFGGSLAAALAIAGAIAWLRLNLPLLGGAVIMTALVLLVSYYAVPSLQRPLFAAVHRVTYPLSLAIGIVLLSIVFFAIILPIALVGKLVGRQAFAKLPDRSAGSYWQRSSVKSAVSQYFRMY